MFEKISIDCLNIIFSFGSTNEMGNVSCVNKECRRIVRKCNYAWYQMYTRFVTSLAPAKHLGEYTYECLRNPCITDGCRGGRNSQSLITKSFNICLHYRDLLTYHNLIEHRLWILNANRMNSLSYERSKQSMDFNILTKINQELKHCVNPAHQSLPIYEQNVNYRRKFRIEYLTMHKKTKFTAADEKKLTKCKLEYDEFVQKRKRYIECVLYITILKAKDMMLTDKDVKKMNELYDKIKLLERKKRIAKLMENYE